MDGTVEIERDEIGVMEQIFKDAMIGLAWVILNLILFVMIYNNILVQGYIDSYPISDMTALMLGDEVIAEELINQLVIDDKGRILHQHSFVWGVLVGVVMLWSTRGAQSIRGFFKWLSDLGDQWRARNQGENAEANEDVEPKSDVVFSSDSQ